MKKKDNRGGARKGAGRKAGEKTRTKSFRLNDDALTAAEKKHGKKLNRMANEWIKGI